MLDERAEGVDVAAGIAEDPHLTEPQKHELIRLYRAFRRDNEAAVPVPPGEVESHAG
jgi:hypothetical protein